MIKGNLETISSSQQNHHFADLHIHSTYSDGSFTPHKIIEVSKALNLKVIAIADHDTVSGVDETTELARGGIEVIPAVEMSSNIGDLDIHILGYYIDHRDAGLLSYLASFRRHRAERVRRIIEKLAGDGIRLEFEQIKAVAKDCSFGRPHIAEVLLENGYVRSINEAFLKYLGYDSVYYVAKKKVQPKEVMQKIRDCKGVPVIAHPGTIEDELHIYQLIVDGALGIEVWHPDHTKKRRERFYEIALKNGLIMTGGSDCHGRGPTAGRIGLIGCGQKEVQMLKRCRDKVNQGN